LPPDGDPRHPRNRRRLVFVAAALLVIAIIVLLLMPARRKPEERLSRPAPPATPSIVAPVETPPVASSAPAAAQRIPGASPDEAPVIDEIQVEKPEVCSGEENLITIRAHTVNGTDPFLHYVVDGQMGKSVPLRLWLGDDGQIEGQHFVRVFGRTNTPVTVPLPPYRVKNCQPRRLLSVEHHLRANSWSDFDFFAKIVTVAAPGRDPRKEGLDEPFAVLSYAWSFGDGEQTTTATPLVTHSYEGRKQESLYAYFVVGVDIVDKKSEKLSGRTTLALINPGFEAYARKGIVQLLIALDPRFPELGSDGRVVQRVRLWHTRPEPVTIESATLTEYYEGGSGSAKPKAVDVVGVLGTATIPPGPQGIATTVVLDTAGAPGVFSATYRLSGKSEDGHPAMGSFSIMKPPPRPTADNSRQVVDPVRKAKILAARQILGQDVVTDEEIWQLEREGLLANLVVPPGSAAAAQAPMQPLTPPAPIDPKVPTRGPPVPTSVTPPPTATMAPGGVRPGK